MQPKNIVERKKTFLSFLLLFVLSTVVIVLLAFSSTRVPIKDNQLLQKQVAELDREREFSRKFMSQMTEIVSLLDSINTNGINSADLLEGEISTGITKLNVMIDIDSVHNKDFYRSVVLNISDLQRAKKQLRNATAGDTDINQVKRLNESLTNQLEQCKDKKDQLQLQLMQALKN
jgi:Type VI secretion system, TssO